MRKRQFCAPCPRNRRPVARAAFVSRCHEGPGSSMLSNGASQVRGLMQRSNWGRRGSNRQKVSIERHVSARIGRCSSSCSHCPFDNCVAEERV